MYTFIHPYILENFPDFNSSRYFVGTKVSTSLKNVIVEYFDTITH